MPRPFTPARAGRDLQAQTPDIFQPDDCHEYNYDRFDEYVKSGAEFAEFSGFPNHLHAGDPAPDALLIRLDDEAAVRLSDLWSERNVVLEFGSFT